MNCIRKILPIIALTCAGMIPNAAYADWGIIDAFDLSPFVPIVLDAFMTVATGGYEFFVGNGDGIIYLMIWGFLAISVALYLVKIYLPAKWVGFFGFSGGGELAAGADAWTIAKNVFTPGMRAVVAAVVLLQIKPVFITEWLVNPFLEVGALYTDAIVDGLNSGATTGGNANAVKCPPEIVEKAWISERSCQFLVQPVADLSAKNNQMIKRGFQFLHRGLRGLITMIPHGGTDVMNIITGIILIATFASCNIFMALLIIQGIFNFGMALILYPFQVLVWVAKPSGSKKWFDIWPAFSGITKALQQLIVTMIACAFILMLNIAIVRALFQWNTTTYVVAAGGYATSNIPTMANTGMGFGEHSVTWMSALLTFYLMLRIFELTRKRLEMYTKGQDELYRKVMSDAPAAWNRARATYKYGKPIVTETAKTVWNAGTSVVSAVGRTRFGRRVRYGAYRAGRAIRGWF